MISLLRTTNKSSASKALPWDVTKVVEELQTKGCPEVWLTVAMEGRCFTARGKAEESSPPVNQWLLSPSQGPSSADAHTREKYKCFKGVQGRRGAYAALTSQENNRLSELKIQRNNLDQVITNSNKSESVKSQEWSSLQTSVDAAPAISHLRHMYLMHNTFEFILPNITMSITNETTST